MVCLKLCFLWNPHLEQNVTFVKSEKQEDLIIFQELRIFNLKALNYISGFDVLPPQKGLDPRARLSSVDRRAEEEVGVPDARTVHRPKDRKTP